MGEHLYEVGFQVVSAATANIALCEVIPAAWAAGKRPPEIREIGIYNASGVANEVGIGIPAAIGVTPATLKTVQATDRRDVIAGNTTIATTWATPPTIPNPFFRRLPLQAVTGSGDIFVWNPGEFVLSPQPAVNTLVIWQFAATITSYDLYFKVAE